jgi:hypothetical protein
VPPAPIITSRSTRSGRSVAIFAAIAPPSEFPMNDARGTPRRSSAATSCRAYYSIIGSRITGTPERPKRAKSSTKF